MMPRGNKHKHSMTSGFCLLGEKGTLRLWCCVQSLCRGYWIQLKNDCGGEAKRGKTPKGTHILLHVLKSCLSEVFFFFYPWSVHVGFEREEK